MSNLQNDSIFNSATHVAIGEGESAEIGFYLLTHSGKQLLTLLESIPNEKYFVDVAKSIKQKNPKAKITYHRINSINGSVINFNNSDLLKNQ